MAIEEVEKKLYGKEELEPEEEVTAEAFLPPKKFEVEELWAEEKPKKKKPFLRWQTILIILGITVFVFGGGALGFFIYGKFSFDSNDVTVEIFAPRTFKSGDKVTFKTVYKNKSRKTLEEAKLTFYFPENSEIIKKAGMIETEKGKVEVMVSPILRGEEESVDFSARIFGSPDEVKEAKAYLSYKPEKINVFFDSKTSFVSTISSVPIAMDFEFQPNIVSGQETEILLRYSSQSNAVFKGFGIKIFYPSGFLFVSADPADFIDGNIWDIGDLEPMAEGKIKIKGILEGRPGELKFITADIGPINLKTKEVSAYTSLRDSFEISALPFILTQTVNGESLYFANPGDNLNFSIKYRNNTSEVLRSVVIMAGIYGKALDFETIEVENGSFDGVSSTAIWNPGTNPELEFLEPGKEGEVSFRVQVKNPIPVDDFSDRDFIITSTANISTTIIPEKLKGTTLFAENRFDIKVNSKVFLGVKVYYYDDVSPIPNSGPIPPKVGEATTYTIVWQILNSTNDIENVEVTAFLPPYIKWLDITSPAGLNVSYDLVSGRLVWKIDKVYAGTGILRPVLQFIFQISFTPSLADVGQSVDLISETELRAKDSFTEQILTAKAGSKDTMLPDDPGMEAMKGKVVR